MKIKPILTSRYKEALRTANEQKRLKEHHKLLIITNQLKSINDMINKIKTYEEPYKKITV